MRKCCTGSSHLPDNPAQINVHLQENTSREPGRLLLSLQIILRPAKPKENRQNPEIAQ